MLRQLILCPVRTLATLRITFSSSRKNFSWIESCFGDSEKKKSITEKVTKVAKADFVILKIKIKIKATHKKS